MERVDSLFEKYGVMIEPDLRFKNFLNGLLRTAQYQETDPAKLQKQVNDLSDLLVLVVKERDKLQHSLHAAKERLRFLNLKFWVLSGVVVAQGGALGWLATQLFARLR